MFTRKTILISLLLACTALTGTVFLVNGPMRQLSIAGNEVGDYMVVIDKDHPFLPTSTSSVYGFELHDGGNYGYMSVTSTSCLSMDNLPEEYSDYLLSWTASDNYGMRINYNTAPSDYYIGGIKHTLYNFPDAYKVEMFFANPQGCTINAGTYGWNDTEETIDPDKHVVKETWTIKTGVYTANYWHAGIDSKGYTESFYIKSIKIWYTCTNY